MNLDIHTGVSTAFMLAAAGALLSLWLGIRTIRSGQKLMFFRKRRDLMVRGWRMMFTAAILGVIAFSLFRFAEPAAYKIFPPSPTVTITPTITLTPTISETPTITPTPSITPTSAISPTPVLPPDIVLQFQSSTTPDPASVFSTLTFSKKVDENNLPVDPQTEFKNPIGSLYATFSFDKMVAGTQWTAVWYQVANWKMICYETKPWDASTGGYGYTECAASADLWQPGEYEVQLFVGQVWSSSGRFVVTGTPPTATATASPSRTPLPTATPKPTSTITPTRTETVTLGPSLTPTASLTPTITITRTPSMTPTITQTRPPTSTMKPTITPRITETRWPSPTSQ
jgi:hypothetical protein